MDRLLHSTLYKRSLGSAALGFLLATLSFIDGTAQASTTSFPNGWIDAPAQNARLRGAGAVLSGWALDAASVTGTGVDRVAIYLDSELLGNAVYGSARPDMSAAFGARYLNSGYQFALDLSRLGGGTHVLEARAHSAVSGQSTSSSRTVVVVKPLGFGANAHLMWYGLDAAIQDLDRIRAAGLTSVRFDYNWSTAELSSKGAYDQSYLTKLDGVIAAARARGIRVNIVVVGTPAWARGNAGTMWTPPSHSVDYADHLSMLARRYAGVPNMSYEIWNEPNERQYWNAPGGPSPAVYGRLLNAVYPRVKAAAPTALVLGGSIAFNDQAYITGLYINGGAKGFFDALALHPYSHGYSPESTASVYDSFVLDLQNMQSTMASFGEPNKPIWITESGWSTNYVTDAVRATYFQQAVSMLADGFPHVEQYQVYALNQAEDLPDMSLTTASGAPTLSWTAYLDASKQAVAARAL